MRASEFLLEAAVRKVAMFTVAVAAHGVPAVVGLQLIGWEPWSPGAAMEPVAVNIVWRATEVPPEPEAPMEPVQTMQLEWWTNHAGHVDSNEPFGNGQLDFMNVPVIHNAALQNWAFWNDFDVVDNRLRATECSCFDACFQNHYCVVGFCRHGNYCPHLPPLSRPVQVLAPGGQQVREPQTEAPPIQQEDESDTQVGAYGVVVPKGCTCTTEPSHVKCPVHAGRFT